MALRGSENERQRGKNTLPRKCSFFIQGVGEAIVPRDGKPGSPLDRSVCSQSHRCLMKMVQEFWKTETQTLVMDDNLKITANQVLCLLVYLECFVSFPVVSVIMKDL